MREFLSQLLMPVPYLLSLLLSAIVLLRLNARPGAKILLRATAIWFLLITTRPLPQLLVKSLEGQYVIISDARIHELKGKVDIIVLGGGHSDNKNLTPNNQLSSTAIGRLVEGIRIHRIIPDSRLLLSGYRGRTSIPQALVLYRAALILGVDSSSMAVLTMPANTRMEAEEYFRNYGTENNLILVTSAIHMPRAVKLFRETGLDPVPAPANYFIKGRSPRFTWRWIMPKAENVAMLELAVHEFKGMAWNWIGMK